jgi:glycerophosphoryl diester phosphodiesterase
MSWDRFNAWLRAEKRLRLIGHRGARGAAPENTLAAFALALEAGVDGVEFDLHLSRDGEPVVMHDARLERTTDSAGEIGTLTLAELRQLNAAARFNGPGEYGIKRVPTLGEVLALTRGRARNFLEIKLRGDGTRYSGIEARVLATLQQHGDLESSLICSFDFPTLKTVNELAPEVVTQPILSTGYLEPFRQHDSQILPGAAIAADLANQGFGGAAIDQRYLTPALCRTLKAARLSVHVWTVNEATDMWRFAAMGVDLITTDRPDVLVQAYRHGRLAL